MSDEVASRRKPPSLPTTSAPPPGLHNLTSEGPRPISLAEINSWDVQWQRMLFRVLLPVDTLVRFGIDPVSLADRHGLPAARVIPGDRGRSIRLEVYHSAGAVDPFLEMELSDTPFNQIEVIWIGILNPYSPRFDVDKLPDGQPTMRGLLRRNLEAEQAALAAGLAPGQVRRGLGSFGRLATRMESFMACINQREYTAQPLFYHTAILFERIGFSYVHGHALMERINQGFAPGGDLRQHLDGSTPFRRPELANSIRGRAWAIHDGILNEPWDRVRMIKRLGSDAEVNTAAGVPW